ncbi:MAG: polysaccharide deacetylase family protein [Chthoniobacterales bacterium]
MPGDKFVFHDVRGIRWGAFKIFAVVAGIISAAALGLFLHSLFVAPSFVSPNSLAELKTQLRAEQGRRQTSAAVQKQGAEPGGLNAKNPSLPPDRRKSSGGIKAAFFSPDDSQALESLRAHGGQLTHLCPSWLEFVDPGGDWTGDEAAAEWELPESGSAKLMPGLSNLHDDERVPEAVEALSLEGEDEQVKFATRLAEKLEAIGAAGVVLDWQEVDQGADHELSRLVARIAGTLREHALETWLCVSPDATFAGWDYELLGRHVDHFVILLHDEHGAGEAAGPIASQEWFEGWLETMGRTGTPGKWIVSLGCYGADWAEGRAGAEQISFADAMSRAGNAGCGEVRTDAPFFNGTFSYFSQGDAHEVWFLDAASLANQYNAVRDRGLAGIALNRVGLEDPGIWKILAANTTATADMLEQTMPGGLSVTSIGRGEVVNLDPTTLPGRRAFTVNSSGQISCHYETPPAHPTLFCMGGTDASRVCLTFDDGPDPDWTPAILDILKERGLKATFFIVGTEAEKYPDIIRRMAEEGHEIGNHTYTHPNLAEAPEALIKLELNATQRLIESIIGKSTALFRPPYDADARPTSLAELVPIEVAQSLGYLTVLESIDPRDWQEPDAYELLQRVKDARKNGSILLLHDGGGDRSATVEALPSILDYLEERGDRIVNISELVGIDANELMPPVGTGMKSVNFFASSAGFTLMRLLQNGLHAFLILASLLVVVRTALVVFLATTHKFPETNATHGWQRISVIIPACNEEKVIGRTVQSMLDSDYRGAMEILVVDNGSSDRTAEIVLAMTDQRVRLLRLGNRGKARALEHGVKEAQGDLLVFADADTQFARGALTHLVAPLADPAIGAVSGQARVGNLRTFLGRCQHVEYLCSFNLDRRAYAAWNCITVVPGAISAVRRTALEEAGGFSRDTLAEDTDLTLSIHRAGHRVAYAPQALAYTEAPETYRQLARQRFRWAFGTLQCVWKHRDIVFNPRFKALGWFSLPSIWFFQVLLVAFSPLIDLLFLQALLLGHALDILPFFLGFIACDIVLAIVAMRIERLPLREAWWVIPQRFVYRPLLAYVVWKALLQAVRGALVGWGQLPRTASVPAT